MIVRKTFSGRGNPFVAVSELVDPILLRSYDDIIKVLDGLVESTGLTPESRSKMEVDEYQFSVLLVYGIILNELEQLMDRVIQKTELEIGEFLMRSPWPPDDAQ